MSFIFLVIIYIVTFFLSFIYCSNVFIDCSFLDLYHNYFSDKNIVTNSLEMLKYLTISNLSFEDLCILRELLSYTNDSSIETLINIVEITDLLRFIEANESIYTIYGEWIEIIQNQGNHHSYLKNNNSHLSLYWDMVDIIYKERKKG